MNFYFVVITAFIFGTIICFPPSRCAVNNDRVQAVYIKNTGYDVSFHDMIFFASCKIGITREQQI